MSLQASRTRSLFTWLPGKPEPPMPVVSVILPTCDRPDLWPRALKSVLRQSWTDLEVVLVDSNRRTPRLRDTAAFALFQNDARVVLINRPHAPSAAAARNTGLAVARGEWVTYLDDDDVYCVEKIERQYALAQQSNAAIVLCGYTVVLPRRRRTRQVAENGFRGDKLLTAANWGTPMLFHRRDPLARFDEALRAGEDEVFAHAFLLRNQVTIVPNCPLSLIEVFPQVGQARVHHGEAVWRAYQVNWHQVRRQYSRTALRQYLAMGRLVRAQNCYGSATHFLRCARAALAIRGPGAWRLVANATAHRFGLLSKWAVS